MNEVKVEIDGRVRGFTRATKGGFFRGYMYAIGVGLGPFRTREDAEQWVRNGDASAPVSA